RLDRDGGIPAAEVDRGGQLAADPEVGVDENLAESQRRPIDPKVERDPGDGEVEAARSEASRGDRRAVDDDPDRVAGPGRTGLVVEARRDRPRLGEPGLEPV